MITQNRQLVGGWRYVRHGSARHVGSRKQDVTSPLDPPQHQQDLGLTDDHVTKLNILS
jgi:hypothetical protein